MDEVVVLHTGVGVGWAGEGGKAVAAAYVRSSGCGTLSGLLDLALVLLVFGEGVRARLVVVVVASIS